MTEHECTVGEYLSLVKWFQNLPDTLKPLVSRFFPGSKWRLRGRGLRILNGRAYGKHDYLMPESFSHDGAITVVHCDGMSGAIKQYVEVNPKVLVPYVAVVEKVVVDGARRNVRDSRVLSI